MMQILKRNGEWEIDIDADENKDYVGICRTIARFMLANPEMNKVIEESEEIIKGLRETKE